MDVGLSYYLAALLLGATPQAQHFTSSENPVVAAVRSVLDRESVNLIASADLMPAEKYDYRPTSAQMSFGQLMAHVVQTNIALCSALTSAMSPMPPDELAKADQITTKDALVPLLKQSFDYCKAALRDLQDAELASEAMVFRRATGMSRAGVLVTIATDWADHYSTTAGYLRLNGILPPSAQMPTAQR